MKIAVSWICVVLVGIGSCSVLVPASAPNACSNDTDCSEQRGETCADGLCRAPFTGEGEGDLGEGEGDLGEGEGDLGEGEGDLGEGEGDLGEGEGEGEPLSPMDCNGDTVEVVPGTPIAGAFISAGDINCFRFRGLANNTFAATLSQADAEIAFFDNNTRIGRSFGGGPAGVLATTTSDTNLRDLVVVARGNTAAYSFVVEATPDEGNTTDSATPLADALEARIAVLDDVDVYALSLPGLVSVDVTAEVGFALTAELLAADGGLIDGADSTQGAIALTGSDVAFVRLSSASFGAYGIVVTAE
jgi:hypothetical protein